MLYLHSYTNLPHKVYEHFVSCTMIPWSWAEPFRSSQWPSCLGDGSVLSVTFLFLFQFQDDLRTEAMMVLDKWQYLPIIPLTKLEYVCTGLGILPVTCCQHAILISNISSSYSFILSSLSYLRMILFFFHLLPRTIFNKLLVSSYHCLLLFQITVTVLREALLKVQLTVNPGVLHLFHGLDINVQSLYFLDSCLLKPDS